MSGVHCESNLNAFDMSFHILPPHLWDYALRHARGDLLREACSSHSATLERAAMAPFG
jgi:hypothetical protein